MEAVFINVLNMSIRGSWLILAVLLLRPALRKAPRWITVLLWGMAGLRLILPFSLVSPFSLLPSAEPISPDIGYAPHPTIDSGIGTVDGFVNPLLGESLAAEPTWSANPMQIWLLVGSSIWVRGIIILSVYSLISYLLLRRKLREAVPYRGNILLCDAVTTPFVLGIFRPRVYLPSSLTDQEMKTVLAHELAHLARRDHLTKLVGFFIFTIHWFNPLVWIAYILLGRDIEEAADERVIREMAFDERKAYAGTLVSLGAHRRAVLVCPLAFAEIGVKERVRRVLHYKKPAFWIIGAAAFVCLILAVCFLTDPMAKEPDLSFLNYENAVSLAAETPEIPVIWYPPVKGDADAEIRPGSADGAELAHYLALSSWKERRLPSNTLPSPGSVEFCIRDDYRITVYESPARARVSFMGDVRWYSTGANDYERAVGLFRNVTVPRCKAYFFDEFTVLTLFEDGRFSFSYDPLSSYLSVGTFEKNEDLLTCRTSDGKYTYSFLVRDDTTLVFDAAGSSPLRLTDDRFGALPEDGSEFLLRE